MEHSHEFFRSRSNEEIFIQSFTPAAHRGICYVLHGYFDHSGSMSQLIRYLTSNQFKVIAYDLQGHGLSTGDRGAIRTFDDYVDLFKEIMERYRKKADQHSVAIAHSTGGAILMDYLLQYGGMIEKAVLVSPLVRSHNWHMSRAGLILMKRVAMLPRVYKRNSSNHDYLQRVKKDPLQNGKIPVGWFQALVNWQNVLENYPDSDKKIMVIQGDKDKTVDWKYNLAFIKRKFPNCEVRIIRGGNHQLLNEREDLLKQTFNCLDSFIIQANGD
ncbi:alpha/beta fold hydrolase [Bacillus sp. FJAT-27251]|uniref:alpha/beta hydrolase n=1 Tax=Bacillus sp. FJAT-27251 TaxID=1684142 RepID=UPI0018D04A8B|nr:alpha/beta fold hydrolase [Bacillus sp. FJAT-27251]